jgi:sugar (pentulose or hexulose) kinase
LSRKSLLIDFGASRIKAALLYKGKVTNIRSYASLSALLNTKNRYEIDIFAIKNKFLTILKEYLQYGKLSSIFICSEMHGFTLLDESNEPKSNYVSWKDERCLDYIDGNISSFDTLKRELGDFFLKTGMNVRPCYPIFNIFHMIREKEIGGYCRIVSLPEWLICSCCDKSFNVTHDTICAGLGFYDIYTKSIDRDLMTAITNGSKIELAFNDVSSEVKIGGYIVIDGEDCPIFCGIGDYQCAVLGAGNDESSISVNLGTGSQVGVLSNRNENIEKRPFFDNRLLKVIAHIPSGRSLNEYIGFLQEINPLVDFWKKLNDITVEEIKNSKIDMNLSVFTSAWCYKDGGAITKIKEGNFKLNSYLSSLLRCYITQYVNAIKIISPSQEVSKIILSGGIATRLKNIKPCLNKLTGYEVFYPETHTVDILEETLVGLKVISEKIEAL